MRAQNIGRALGIGLRITGKFAEELLAGTTQNGSLPPKNFEAEVRRDTSRSAVSPSAGQASGNLVRGMGGFLRPFRRVGGILWLEITGVFFLLPVVAFAPKLWATRTDWARGPDHWRFLITAAVMAVFLYLSVSSFWRARKR